jgi:ATP-dependent DNA helicase RecQ
MKIHQDLRINHARREMRLGGDFSELDHLTQGRVHILETPINHYQEVELALDELVRINWLENMGKTSHWGCFAIIARHWETLEPMEALCRQRGIPVRLMRDESLLDLHSTREGHSLLSLLGNKKRGIKKLRVVLRFGSLSRWFRYRYKQSVNDLIEHPYRAMLAGFIIGCEEITPNCQHVVSDLIEILYEFRSGIHTGKKDGQHAPLQLMTAHRAKGLEFDHVLILDGGGWQEKRDDERRLYYVAMTRARKTLTLCSRKNTEHAFISDCKELCLKTQPQAPSEIKPLGQRTWVANPKQVILSWPGYFAANSSIHSAIAHLDVGDVLILRPKSNNTPGWELADATGQTVARMAQSFRPPIGEITETRVAAIQVRTKKTGDPETILVPERKSRFLKNISIKTM